MILNDKQILELCEREQMITPYHDRSIKSVEGEQVISFGISSFGYDIRISEEYEIFSPSTGKHSLVDPKNIDGRIMSHYVGDKCIIPPNSFALARTREKFKMPEDVLGVVLGKSTYARCGIIVNCTPLEPGWKGYVTLEISNTTPLPAVIYSDEGISQVLFFRGDRPMVTYADRGGKYQNQTGITMAKI